MSENLADDFWHFCLRVYGVDEIKDTCLHLQDEYKLNVNVLLFCVWSEKHLGRTLGEDFFRESLRDFWHCDNDVLQPLRAVRRQYKLWSQQLDNGHSYRQLLAAEVDMEKAAQRLLVQALSEYPQIKSTNARDSVHAYCNYTGVQVTELQRYFDLLSGRA